MWKRWLRRRLATPFDSLGWLLLLVLVGYQASEFGSSWTWGRYYMPRSMVAADGWHYANGKRMSVVTKALIDADREEEVEWNALLFLVIVMSLLVAVRARDEYRQHRQFQEQIRLHRRCQCSTPTQAQHPNITITTRRTNQ